MEGARREDEGRYTGLVRRRQRGEARQWRWLSGRRASRGEDGRRSPGRVRRRRLLPKWSRRGPEGKEAGAILADHAAAVTLFGHPRGRLSLAIYEDMRAPPAFLIELPMLAAGLHRGDGHGTLKLVLGSDTRSARRPLLSNDEWHVLRLLRGVSMSAGVLPPPPPADGSNFPDGIILPCLIRIEEC